MTDIIMTKLLHELRQGMSNLMGIIHTIAPTVLEHGGTIQTKSLNAGYKQLYSLLRTISHITLTLDQTPVFRPVTLDLAGLCRKLGREVESLAPAIGVEFLCDIREASLLTRLDEDLFELAVLNLLTNSFQIARQYGGPVTLRLTRTGKMAKVSVLDEGPGLPAFEDKPDSSAGCFRSDDSLRLGLEVAKRTAALHDGMLLHNSTASGGLEAVLMLPVCFSPRENHPRQLRSPQMGYERNGGFSNLMQELSPVLPIDAYDPEDHDPQ